MVYMAPVKIIYPRFPRRLCRIAGAGFLLTAACAASGCNSLPAAPDLSSPIDLGMVADSMPPAAVVPQPDITPRTLFDVQANPQMRVNCLPCHAVAQGSVGPFLTTGLEYQSITSYRMGLFINVLFASQSLLTQKGPHTGPGFTPDQLAAVTGWLSAEIVTRPSALIGNLRSALLPTVPIAASDYNMNFGTELPISDPGANLTLTLEPAGGAIYQANKLTLTAGPKAGIHIQHPRFYYLSAAYSLADPADELAAVDMVIPASTSRTIGSGLYPLRYAMSNDANTRIGLSFTLLEQVNPTGVVPACKAFPLFSSGVVPELKKCAGQCHRPGSSNAAANSWDLAAALGTDPNSLQQLCVTALGRINLPLPAQSILLTQPLPSDMGGTLGHPYKLLAADVTRFGDALRAWIAAEK